MWSVSFLRISGDALYVQNEFIFLILYNIVHMSNFNISVS